ncbi:MBL fold metallo-hydrolase, partial [bacterium]|nr:MBL fold metallo-hydrolase [bacterium]
GYTLPVSTMTGVLKRLKSSVVIPMHWFTDFGLQNFVSGMVDEFDVKRVDGSSIEVSLATLPKRPTIFLLRPSWLRDNDE